MTQINRIAPEPEVVSEMKAQMQQFNLTTIKRAHHQQAIAAQQALIAVVSGMPR